MRLLCVRVLACCSLGLAVGVLAPETAGAADIEVILDQARLVKLPDRAAIVVVGNPAIADAAVQSGGWMIVTGKGHGLTNIVALDRSGAILLEKTVEVQGPRDAVVVYRGVERFTYNCSPDCERTLTLGDNTAAFSATAAQIGARNGLAASSAQTR